MLAADLNLSGTQTLSGGAYVIASKDTSLNQHEMTLDVNPTNPLNLAGFSHSTDSTLNIRTDVFYTRDGGLTWYTTRIGDSEDGRTGLWRFDPSIAFDTDGNLFIAYGVVNDDTNMTELVVARSQDGGETFDPFTQIDSAPGLNLDKWHLATGPSGPNNAGQAVYVAYSLFDEIDNGSGETDVVATVYVAGSNDAGVNFTDPIPISDGTAVNIYADPAVGPNGELYISWWDTNSDELKFDRDLNGLWVDAAPADEFGAETTVISLNHDVFRRKVPAQPDRGITPAPVLDVDRSGGQHDGRLYLTYGDIATGQTLPNYDIYLVTSDDMGASWSSSATGVLQGNVEDSTGTDFHPWVDVDQTTGSVNFIYYTTDGDQQAENERVNARLASSIDGGDTFVHTDLSLFTSNEEGGSTGDYLEYIGLAVHDGTAHGLWSSRLDPEIVPFDLEALWASAATTSASNVLTVTGEDVGAKASPIDDVLTIKLNDDRIDYLEVWWSDDVAQPLDVLQFAGRIDSIGKINIDRGAGMNTVTVAPGVETAIGTANITYVDAPRVVNVLFSRDEGGPSIPPDLTVDMAVEVFGQGINQLVSLPQGGVNQIEVEFDRPVEPNSISLVSLDLIPLRKLGNLVNSHKPTGYTVAADNLSATWDFDYTNNLGIASDQYALRLHDTVLGASGEQLNGEWTNPIRTTDTSGWSFADQSSGDGSQGGDFDFYFTLLGADFNTDNVVDLLDLDILGAHFGFNPADFNDGDANGDGSVDLLDLEILGVQFGFDWKDLGTFALMNADFDGNGQVDLDDNDGFYEAFGQGLEEADLNGDGVWDGIDFNIFGVFLSFQV